MPFDAKAVNIMIAGPSDVNAELQHVQDIIHNWNVMHAQDRRIVLLPLGWKSHAWPEMGDRPQAIIDRQVLSLSDLLVAVFWTRIGTPTGTAISGTVEEIEEHLAAGKQAMLYFSNAPVHPNNVDENQFQAVRQFRDECLPKGIVERYSSMPEFREKFLRQLTLAIFRNFKVPTSEANIKEIAPLEPSPSLSPEAKQLLLEGSADPNGIVMCLSVMEGLIISANNKTFAEPGNARLEATWKAAVEQLEELRLIQSLGPERQVFSVTHEGYKLADRLRQESAPNMLQSNKAHG
jgi:hypothetical protein